MGLRGYIRDVASGRRGAWLAFLGVTVVYLLTVKGLLAVEETLGARGHPLGVYIFASTVLYAAAVLFTAYLYLGRREARR